MECGSYRGIKLLEQAMKVVERIFEQRIRQQIKVDDMQFGFMKGKGTTDAIFMARQMQENFRVKGKMVRWMCGVKLKDRLPSKELRERLGVDDIALVLQQNRQSCVAKRRRRLGEEMYGA